MTVPSDPVAEREHPAGGGGELTGPVDVCVAVPKLSLDRPFTYLMPESSGAGTGSLVSVPFHGRTVRGWVLGPAEMVPPGRLLPVRKVRSPVRFFDAWMLDLYRWVSHRYIAPLATVIERSHPPRVVGEERELAQRAPLDPASTRAAATGDVAGFAAARTTWFRPLPDEEAMTCVEAMRACVAAGRRAIVLVPQAEPLPFTARAVLEAFGERAVGFLGGDGRERYRTWLQILRGRFDVVVGTRPAVFAPLAGLGLIWISREVHPAHREDRAPYYHVREVGAERARIEGAACVLASLSPSVVTAAGIAAGAVLVRRSPRQVERAAAPLVETTAPEAEDRSTRLAGLIRRARSGALIVTRAGYGVARVCRSCGAAAACSACGGALVVEGGATSCRACGAPGRCARCGGVAFGVERGGVERVGEWAGRLATVPVTVAPHGSGLAGPATTPGPGRIVVGTVTTVEDLGPVRLDVVGILDPDRALARSDIPAGEQALAIWMEAAAWAGPKAGGGRVLLQTRHPWSAAVQALVRWDPLRFLGAVADERARAGFPAGHPTFRLDGVPGDGLGEALRDLGVTTLLESPARTGTVCLVAVQPGSLPGFRAGVLDLVASGIVTRVEAEPSV